MKKYSAIVIIIILEVLSLAFINFDKGTLVLLWTALTGYIAMRHLFPQSPAMAVAESHRYSASTNQPLPDMSLSSEKNFDNRVRSIAEQTKFLHTKWLYLGLTLINIALLILIMKEIIIIK